MNAKIYPNPFALKYDSSATGTFPSVTGETGLGQSTYYEHEVGVDQINPDGTTTAITSSLESYDFDLDLQGQGEFFLSIRRFIPDFKTLTGNATVTFNLKRFPSDTATASTFSPFTVTSSTQKFNTRARGRFASLKIANLTSAEDWRFGTVRIDVQPDGRR